MAGPNREWHIGDHGPGPTAWSERGPKPCAQQVPQAVVFPLLVLKPRMGRDPNDRATMELPLDNGGSFVVGGRQCGHQREDFVPPVPDNIVTRIAAGLYEEADDEVPWLLLMLKELSDDEQAAAGDFRFKARAL